MAVYFLERGEDYAIKIGFSDNPTSRIANVGRDCLSLKVLAVIPGTRDVEAALHKRFSYAALGHEWFRPNPELNNFLEEIKVLDGVPDYRKPPTVGDRSLSDLRDDIHAQTAELIRRSIQFLAPNLARQEAFAFLSAQTGLPPGRFENVLRGRTGAAAVETNHILRATMADLLARRVKEIEAELADLQALEPPTSDEIFAAMASLKAVRETLDRAKG